MGKVLNWMHHDDATDAAKEDAWRAYAGDRAPHRAWYYSPSFREDDLASLLVALRDVFWSPATKTRVTRDVDVKVEHLHVLPGVPILRVSMPERLVASFVAGDATFVLYKAMIDEKVVDFGHEWGGLRSAARGGSMTVVGNVGQMMDGMDIPPPAAILRNAENRVVPPPPALPPRARAAPALLAPPRLPPPAISPLEVPQAPTIVPDPADAESPAPVAPAAQPDRDVPAPPRIVPRVRPPTPAGWDVFGGRPEAPAPPAPPSGLHAVPPPATTPRDDEELPDDTSDRTFRIVAALAAVLVLLLFGAYFLSAS